MSNQVMRQQFYLNCLGFNAGKVDGLAGIRTSTAIAKFMSKHKDTHNPFSVIITQHAQVFLPPHLYFGSHLLGEAEIPGKKHNCNIVNMWEWTKTAIRNDETPYCSTTVGHFIVNSDYYDKGRKVDGAYLRSKGITAAARSWENYTYSTEGYFGDIAVLWRGSPKGWQGHVGFIVGVDEQGNYWILGGNQGNMINVSLFPTNRILSFRAYRRGRDTKSLPLITAAAEFSKSEV